MHHTSLSWQGRAPRTRAQRSCDHARVPPAFRSAVATALRDADGSEFEARWVDFHRHSGRENDSHILTVGRPRVYRIEHRTAPPPSDPASLRSVQHRLRKTMSHRTALLLAGCVVAATLARPASAQTGLDTRPANPTCVAPPRPLTGTAAIVAFPRIFGGGVIGDQPPRCTGPRPIRRGGTSRSSPGSSEP